MNFLLRYRASSKSRSRTDQGVFQETEKVGVDLSIQFFSGGRNIFGIQNSVDQIDVATENLSLAKIRSDRQIDQRRETEYVYQQNAKSISADLEGKEALLEEIRERRDLGQSVYEEMVDTALEISRLRESRLSVVSRFFKGWVDYLEATNKLDVSNIQLEELRKHRLWGEVLDQYNLAKAIYVNFLINFLGIFTSLFVMAVYNKVIPNSALGSLLSLALGVSVAVLFDWVFKLVKARIVNKACNDIEAALQPKLFFKVVSMDLQSRPKLSGAAATLVRDLDAAIDLFTNSSITTIISLPFVFINLLVIYLIAGSLVMVTLAISLAAFAGSLYFFWSVNQASEAAKQASIDKNSVFLEAFANLETLKSIASYSFFENKWASVDSNSRDVNTGIKLSTSDASSFNAFLLALGQVGIVTYGAYLVIGGETSTGALIATVILNGRTLQPSCNLPASCKILYCPSGYRKLDTMFNTTSREEAEDKIFALRDWMEILRLVTWSFILKACPSPILNTPLAGKKWRTCRHLGSVGSGKSTLLKLLRAF